MKVHPVNCLLAVIISALLTYGVATIGNEAIYGALILGAFISLATTLGGAIGIGFYDSRKGVNIRLVSILFFLMSLILNICFAYLATSLVWYIIVSGIAFCLYILIANSIYGAKG